MEKVLIISGKNDLMTNEIRTAVIKVLQSKNFDICEVEVLETLKQKLIKEQEHFIKVTTFEEKLNKKPDYVLEQNRIIKEYHEKNMIKSIRYKKY